MASAPQPDTSPPSQAVGIVGLGYVGLPLTLAFTKAGRRVIGFDIDPAKTEAITAGRSYIDSIPTADVAAARATGRLDATTDFARVAETDAVILCVPTPLDAHLEPNLSYVRDTLDAVCPHLAPGHLVSLESTTYPGTTEEEVVPRVRARGLEPGRDVFVVYSPEREDPGNTTFTTTRIPKVVGGLTPACLAAGVTLYEAAFETVVPVSSCKVAELTKLLENIYRAVNIGLVNEMKVVATAMGIDIWEVIRAAATKPFGFTPFYPGPGLGGHCIPIDPFYLTWKAREFDFHTEFIELAGKINSQMPYFCVAKLARALNDREKAIKGSTVLVIGVAYKADVNDMRESPALKVISLLLERGANVRYHDPHVPALEPGHGLDVAMTSVPLDDAELAGADVVAVVTAHSGIDWAHVADVAGLVVDFRNAVPRGENVWTL